MSSRQVLAETAVQLPASSGAANIMPGLSNLGEKGHPSHPQRHQQPTAASDAPHHAATMQEAAGHLVAAPPPPPEVPATATVAEAEATAEALSVVRMIQKATGWFVGLGTAAYVLFYQWVIEPAPPGSLPVRWFSQMASGPLRPLLLNFFANASDFTRRLTSVRANGEALSFLTLSPVMWLFCSM